MNPIKAFATTAPGLERVLEGELRALGFSEVRRGGAGAGFRTDRAGLERATLALRTAHRVLWTLGEVDAADGDALYRAARGLVRWQGLVPPDRTFAVFATCRDTPAFRDARFAALRLKDAIADAVREACGERPNVAAEDPDVLVRLSIAHGRGVVSLDAAGRTSLHARGYRLDKGEAPLRESLAAALPLLAGWDRKTPLCDPLCGSGTILIEAALAARGIAPGTLRERHGFMRWPGFKEARLAALRAELGRAAKPVAGVPLIGADVDRDVLELARENATRAGVLGDVTLRLGDATTLGEVPERGLVVTNPPWGARMGERSGVVALLRAFAAHWRDLGVWRAAVLVPDEEAARALGLREGRTLPLESGGREVLLAVGRF